MPSNRPMKWAASRGRSTMVKQNAYFYEDYKVVVYPIARHGIWLSSETLTCALCLPSVARSASAVSRTDSHSIHQKWPRRFPQGRQPLSQSELVYLKASFWYRHDRWMTLLGRYHNPDRRSVRLKRFEDFTIRVQSKFDTCPSLN